MDLKMLGKTIQEARRGRKIDQTQFAAGLKISGSLFAKIEAGTRSINPELLEQIASALGLDLARLAFLGGIVPQSVISWLVQDETRLSEAIKGASKGASVPEAPAKPTKRARKPVLSS